MQLHADFGFADARRIVPYLDRLGISHLYVSPIFAAVPGSMHGYDVLDHNQVNRELGGLQGLYELSEALTACDMGLIVDIVPNHVGIANGANPWWRDVLRHGPASHYASFFDIDWEAQPQLPSGVLIYPILGQTFGAALEAGELPLRLIDGELQVAYYEHALPLAPRSYARAIGLPPVELRPELSDPAAFGELVQIVEDLPVAAPDEADRLVERFRRLVIGEPALRAFVEARLTQLNGTAGDPSSFDELEGILREQHYRLTYWRVSPEETNYRRFFDVNSLAAIRVERDDVFEHVHALLFELVGRGIVTGVRVDHIDGLYDPERYLTKLRERLQAAAGPVTNEPVQVYVEKILEAEEKLPASWPIAGTTGYDFMARVDGLLVDRLHARELTEAYESFIGERVRYRDVAYLSRRQVAETLFAGEISVLAYQLHRIGQRHRLHRDNTLRSLRDSIAATLACFPVYRTYIHEDAPSEGDRELIRGATSEARARDPRLPETALAFLAEVLTLEGPLAADEKERRVHFRRRFQQISGPVMAKGLEDTTFFRYVRLLSLNEVGSMPGSVGTARADVHRWFEERALRWPNAMSASSTHDTKRSEDARARLHVLAEIPEAWRRQVRAWARANRRHKRTLQGEPAPDPNTEYYLYQTLVASWPDAGISDKYRERIHEHLTKAMREMKIYTSWISVEQAYEDACHEFLSAILDRRQSPAFVSRVDTFVRQVIAPAAHLNTLAAVTLKACAPGFPDFFQGTELPVLALTDPDNRRPVDFDARTRTVDTLDSHCPPPDAAGRKLWLTSRLLGLRCAHPDLFEHGSYRPVDVTGPEPERAFAFAREHDGQTLLVVVPRLPARLGLATESARAADRWTGTSLDLAGLPSRWEDALTGKPRTVDNGASVAGLFSDLPVAVLFSGAPS